MNDAYLYIHIQTIYFQMGKSVRLKHENCYIFSPQTNSIGSMYYVSNLISMHAKKVFSRSGLIWHFSNKVGSCRTKSEPATLKNLNFFSGITVSSLKYKASGYFRRPPRSNCIFGWPSKRELKPFFFVKGCGCSACILWGKM